MKFREGFLTAMVASVGVSSYIGRRDVSAVGENNKKHLVMSFDKLKGDSAENARLGKRAYAVLRKRDDGHEEVDIKNEGSFYSVELDIGTPSQKIKVLIDTGSSDLWVPGSDNPYCSSSTRGSKLDKRQDSSYLSSVLSDLNSALSGLTATGEPGQFTSSVGGVASQTSSVPASQATLDCSEYGTFNTSASSSWKSNDTRFYISYADGSFASGVWGVDQMHLDDVDVSGLSFAVSNYTDSQFGVLGIGLPGSESTYSGRLSSKPYQYDNFPMVLRRNGVIDRTAYSVYLNDLDADSGSILFGAIDHSKYTGDLYTIPLVNALEDKGYDSIIQLTVTLQGMGLSANDTETTFTETQYPALLDTGTTYCYFPTDLARTIATSVGATYSSSAGYYLISCDSANSDYNLVFDFGGFHIVSPLKDYIVETRGSVCVLAILPQTDNEINLGDAFLTSAYVVYDLEGMEISLAQARYGDNEEQIEVIKDSVPSAIKASGYSSTWSSEQSLVTGGDIFTVSSNGTSSDTTSRESSRPSSTGRSSQTASSPSSTSSSSSSSSSKSNMANSISLPSCKSMFALVCLAVSVSAFL